MINMLFSLLKVVLLIVFTVPALAYDGIYVILRILVYAPLAYIFNGTSLLEIFTFEL